MSIQLRFVRRLREAENAESFYFQSESPLHFQAGQFLHYTLPLSESDNRGSARSFTIASAPSEPLVRLTTRMGEPPSSFKHALAQLVPGNVVEANGPYGQFVYHHVDRPAVFIAGGIGITPFRAMLGDLAASPRVAGITLLYSNSTADIAFRTFLDSVAAAWPRVRVVYTVTRPDLTWRGPTGRIDKRFIQHHVPEADAKRAMFYVCGPTGFVQAMHGLLADMGVESSRIREEGFPGYEPAVRPSALVGS